MTRVGGNTSAASFSEERVRLALSKAKAAAEEIGPLLVTPQEIDRVAAYFNSTLVSRDCETRSGADVFVVRPSGISNKPLTEAVAARAVEVASSSFEPRRVELPPSGRGPIPSRSVIAPAYPSLETAIHTPPKELRDIVADFSSSGSSPGDFSQHWWEVIVAADQTSNPPEIEPALEEVDSRGRKVSVHFYLLLKVTDESGLDCGAYVSTWRNILLGVYGSPDLVKNRIHIGDGFLIQKCHSWIEAKDRWSRHGHKSPLKLWVSRD